MLLNSARWVVSVPSSSRAKKPLTLVTSTELSPVPSTIGRLSRTAGPIAWMTIKPANITVVSAMIKFRLIIPGWRIVESPLVICATSPHCVVLMLMFNLSSHGLCSAFVLAGQLSWSKNSKPTFHHCGSDRLFSVFSVGNRRNRGKKPDLEGVFLL
jgi:hypothetical protein